jgi:hypothetical protein
MVWESEADARWNVYFGAAERYYRAHGDLMVASDHCEDGVELGKWLGKLRTMYKKGKFDVLLSPEHVRALERIGMCWNLDRYDWECNFAEAKEFYLQNKNLDVPAGSKLATWLVRQRRVYAGKVVGAAPLSKGQIRKLESIGVSWETKSDANWQKGYSEAVEYFNGHGNLVMATNYVSPDGFKLGQWLNGHRLLSNGKTITKVTPERKALLDKLGFIWDRRQAAAAAGAANEKRVE